MGLTQDMRSKLIDGLLSVVLMMAGMFVLILLFRPIKLLGTWGYAIYGVVMLLASIVLLVWSQREATELVQAWTGTWGGFCGWTFLEIGHTIGFVSVEDWEGSTLFVLGVLVAAVLWRHLPRGARFWGAIFGLNWGAHLVILVQKQLFASPGTLKIAYAITIVICVAAIAGLLYWLFARSRDRVQRLWIGIGIWILVAIVVFAARG
jgi:hypothetical protein